MGKEKMETRAWYRTLLVLVLCCAGLAVSVQGAGVDTKESGRVMAKLERFCQDKCQQRLSPAPGDPACSHFCGFVAHIRVAHEADLYTLFREGQRNIQPLIWAMNDIVQEKLQAKLDDEDDHTI